MSAPMPIEHSRNLAPWNGAAAAAATAIAVVDGTAPAALAGAAVTVLVSAQVWFAAELAVSSPIGTKEMPAIAAGLLLVVGYGCGGPSLLALAISVQLAAGLTPGGDRGRRPHCGVRGGGAGERSRPHVYPSPGGWTNTARRWRRHRRGGGRGLSVGYARVAEHPAGPGVRAGSAARSSTSRVCSSGGASPPRLARQLRPSLHRSPRSRPAPPGWRNPPMNRLGAKHLGAERLEITPTA